MDTGTVTIKGQVVIPSKIRQKLGLKKGSKVCFIERNDDVIIRPVTKDYFEKMAGFLGTKGKLSGALLESRRKDKALEDRR